MVRKKIIRENVSFEQKIRESCVHDFATSRVAKRNPRDYFQMNFPNPGYFPERDVLIIQDITNHMGGGGRIMISGVRIQLVCKI